MDKPLRVVHAGDLDGLGTVYDEMGSLITKPGEHILKIAENWDIDISSPWRKVLPKIIFAGFEAKGSSRLYITTQRIVLVRDIDTWRQLKEELSPLGVPAAAAKEVHLRRLKSAGARQFCEIWPRNLRVVKIKRIDRRWSWLGLRLIGTDSRQYAITMYRTEGLDPETLTVLQSQFTGPEA